ncbi:MAG TPA: c-type cytochrome [Dehalococcoidia bacterium]|nr:c-type cytochrome [Dehalococcoidia bacterium]
MIGRRGRELAVLGALLIFGAALLAACGSEGSSLLPSQITDGGTLYAQNCAACHGERGRGGIAVSLDDALYQRLTSDETLRQVIERGRPGNQMPAYGSNFGGTLSDQQLDALVRAIRGFGPPQATPPAGAPRLSGQNLPAGDAARGQQVYAASCARCHGQQGEGGSGGALKAPNALALSSDALLRRVIVTGIARRGMPDYANLGGAALTDQQVNDLVALLASWRAGALATPAPGGAH